MTDYIAFEKVVGYLPDEGGVIKVTRAQLDQNRANDFDPDFED